jgi:hypothetical protein
MIRIANLTIDPDVYDYFPESVAREWCILPIGFRGDRFRVIAGRRVESELREGLRKAGFITNLHRISYSLRDLDDVKALIDELYTHQSADISNCEIEFSSRCPRQWLRLRQTENRGVRHCDECNRSVYLCSDAAKAKDQVDLGLRVAVLRDDWIDAG